MKLVAGSARNQTHWLQWLVGASSLVVVLALAFVLALAGCGSSEGEGGEEQGGAEEAEDTVLVYGLDTVPHTTLDARLEAGNPQTQLNVYDRLTNNALDGSIVPNLAESWETTDGTVWTFHLVEGAKFHDGTPVNADAVVFSYEETLKAGSQQPCLNVIDKIEAVDDLTVRFTLKSAAPLPAITAANNTTFIFSPTAVEELGWEKAFNPGGNAGSGPYILKDATTTEVTLVRNEDYFRGWAGDHAKCPDIAVIRQISEPAARIQSLEQGAVQLINQVPATELERLESNPDLKTVTQDIGGLQQMCFFNTKKAPTDNVYFREALYWSIPYEDILSLVYGDRGRVASGPAIFGYSGYDEQSAATPAPKQDLAKAKAALAMSENPNGSKVVLRVQSGADSYIKAAQLWQESAKKIGIDIEIDIVANSVLWSEALSDNPPQHIWLSSWWGAYGYAANFLEAYWVPNPSNGSYYNDPAITESVAEAVALLATDVDAGDQKTADIWKEQLYPQYTMAFITDYLNVPVMHKDLHFEGYNLIDQKGVFFYDMWMEK